MRAQSFVFLILLTSCGGDLLEDHFELPWTNSVAIMKGSRTVTNSPSSSEVELDIIILQGKIFESVKGNYSAQEAVDDIINPYEKMVPTAITFNEYPDEPYTFSFGNLRVTSDPEVNPDPFSIGVLLDTSSPELYSGFGYKNQRIESLIGMIQLADEADEFLIGTYKKKSVNGGLELLRSDFVTYSDELAVELGQISNDVGGATPLYDAAYEMLDIISAKAQNNNKHLIIYASKSDDASVDGFGSAELIQKAQTLGVKISVIWAADASGVDFRLVSQVTAQTGGFGAYAGSSLEGDVSTLFLSAIPILRNEFPYYTLTYEISDPTDGISNPFEYMNYFWVQITDENTDGIGSSLYMNDPIIYFVE